MKIVVKEEPVPDIGLSPPVHEYVAAGSGGFGRVKSKVTEFPETMLATLD